MHEISKTPFFNMLVEEFFIFPESTSNANFYKQAALLHKPICKGFFSDIIFK